MIYNFFLVLAVFAAGFVFWKRGKEEHFAEDRLFDGFLLSVIAGFIAARIFFVLLHFSDFGWSVVTWINIFSHGGLSLPFGVIATVIFLIRFTKAQNWEVYGVLDMWLPGLLLATSIQQIGVFVQGQSKVINLPITVVPIALIVGVILLGASRYVYWLEYRYRTFAWYKSGQDVAKTGFITGLGLIILGVVFLVNSVVISGNQQSIDLLSVRGVFGFSLVAGLVLLLKRSGVLGASKKKR